MQITTRSYIKFAALLTISSISLQTFSEESSRCEVPGMASTCPSKICAFINELKQVNESIKTGISHSANMIQQNVLLLEGETGSGKTKLAHAIAEATDSLSIKIHSCNLLTRYLNGGQKIIDSTVENALSEAKNLKKRAIIIFEGLDDLSCKDDSLSCEEYRTAYTALLKQINTHKNDPHLFFILIASNPAKLSRSLQNQFQDCTVYMAKPNAERRRELLNHFSMQYTKQSINQYCSVECIEMLVRETQNFNVRDFENFYSIVRKCASRDNEPISQSHVIYALNKTKEYLERYMKTALSNAQRSPDVFVAVAVKRAE